MKPIDDEELLNIYFDQADADSLQQVNSSVDLSQRLSDLEADMKLIEQAQVNPHLPDDYGEQLWARIENKIPKAKDQKSWFSGWMNWFHQPRYSFASIILIAGFCVGAYLLGANRNASMSTDLSEQLLAQNIQLHLTQSEIFLTQAANGQLSGNAQMQAQHLLTNNRLFKRALKGHDSQLTETLINHLELVLLEHANNPELIQTESTHNQLLFNVKSVKKQLAVNKEII